MTELWGHSIGSNLCKNDLYCTFGYTINFGHRVACALLLTVKERKYPISFRLTYPTLVSLPWHTEHSGFISWHKTNIFITLYPLFSGFKRTSAGREVWRLLAEERRVPSYEDFVQIGPDSTVATTHPGGHEHPTVDRYL